MTTTVPWHSDLDRDVGLWLAQNRDVSPSDRLRAVKECISGADLDSKTMLHYAACMFICRDLSLVLTNRISELVPVILKGGKDITDNLAKRQKSKAGKHAADALHNLPGGNREKTQAIRDAWASGKYTNRTRCAEEECAALGMSYDAARRALRNTPAPS